MLRIKGSNYGTRTINRTLAPSNGANAVDVIMLAGSYWRRVKHVVDLILNVGHLRLGWVLVVGGHTGAELFGAVDYHLLAADVDDESVQDGNDE